MKKTLALLFAVASTLIFAANLPVLNLPAGKVATAALWQSIDHILGAYPAAVELSYTDDALKIVFSGEVAEVKSGKGDGPYAIFGGCTAEVFLSPEPETNVYYQFAVSPENKLYQAKGGDCLWKGPAAVKTSTSVMGNAWRAEFIIPFAMLGRKAPVAGEKWRANFVFGKSWSPTTDYHDISQFGTVVFGVDAAKDVQVMKFIFRDGQFMLDLVNNGGDVTVNLDRGSSVFLESGKKASFNFAMKGEYHKDIRKCVIRLSNSEKRQVFSALAPVSAPEIGKLEKFYYAPGEIVNTMECGTFPYGKCQVVVPYCKELPKIAAPKGKLTVKENVFYAGDVPFYPVVARKNQFLRILPAVVCGFTKTPFMGSVFGDTIQLNEKSFATAEKDGIPTMFRILYESQLNILKKDASGAIQYEPDQIAVYEKAYKQIKATHPDAIVSIHADGAAQRAARASRCCDVFEYASWGSSYAPSVMAYLGEDLNDLFADVPNAPIVYWLGSFKAGGVSRSAEELRAAIYLCMLRGCAGNVIHLGHGGFPKEDTHAWDMIDNVQSEINSFYADFVKGKNLDIRCTTDETDGNLLTDNQTDFKLKPIYIVCRQLSDGSKILVAVNTMPQSFNNVRIQFNGLVLATCRQMLPYEVFIKRIPK